MLKSDFFSLKRL